MDGVMGDDVVSFGQYRVVPGHGIEYVCVELEPMDAYHKKSKGRKDNQSRRKPSPGISVHFHGINRRFPLKIGSGIFIHEDSPFRNGFSKRRNIQGRGEIPYKLSPR